jgi:hypothetical protein
MNPTQTDRLPIEGNTNPFLPMPTVAVVLDEHGLLPVNVLNEPLIVTFSAWPDVTAGEIYQLLWDDTPAGPRESIIEECKPGDILTLGLPANELTEGQHKLAYRVTNPENGLESDSLHIQIRIDKTAPGSPQLAPIIFPNLIHDGLTSSELESLGNVLTGEIAGYNGIARDDVIRTYWGNFEGPITFVNADDMGLNRVMVQFPRALLEQVGDGEASVHYTVTDLAGNLSMASESVSVTLQLSVITPLPNPTLKEAVGDTLDPANTTEGATVVIDTSAQLKSGEKITVGWKGPKASDEKEKVVTVAEAGKTLEVTFASVLVSANDGQKVEVSYQVARASGIVQDSETVSFDVLSAQLDLPAPTMDTVGADGIVRPSLIPESGATVRVRYPGLAAGDLVKVRWSGATVEDSAVQAVDGQTQLAFTVPKATILASLGVAASVKYLVERGGIERESESLALTVSSGLELDTSPVALNGKVYLFAAHPDVLPAFPTGTTVKRVPQGGQPPYTYTSSDPKIAHVDAEGLVSVRGKGSADITVADASGDSKSYQVTVSGVIECHNVGTGTWSQMSGKAAAIQGRLGDIQELIEIYNAYKGRWPLQQGYWWSSTLAKTVLGAKWYYAKDMHTGVDYSYLHVNLAQGLALR